MHVKIRHCLSGPNRRSSRTLGARFRRHLRREREPGQDSGQPRSNRNSVAGRAGWMASVIPPLHHRLGRIARALAGAAQLHRPLLHALYSGWLKLVASWSWHQQLLRSSS